MDLYLIMDWGFRAILVLTSTILTFFLKDYFTFRLRHERETLTKEEWVRLCAQNRESCSGHICVQLNRIEGLLDVGAKKDEEIGKELIETKAQLDNIYGPFRKYLDESKDINNRLTRLEAKVENVKKSQ